MCFNIVKTRLLRESDVSEHYLDWFSDATVQKWISFRPKNLADLQSYVASNFSTSDCLLVGIFCNTCNRHIGNIRFTLAGCKTEAWVGFLLGDSKHRNKGLTQIAYPKALELAQSKFTKLKFINLRVSRNNFGAIHLYEKLGFVLLEEVDDDCIYRKDAQ